MTDALFDQLALSTPGLWIQHDDRDFAGDVCLLLGFAADQFNEALLAFGPFRPFTIEDVRRDAEGTPLSEDRAELRRRFMYAKMFVYSLDATRAFVHVVSTVTGIPKLTADACEAFRQEFGYIRDIRNSLQHIEERAQAKGQFGRRLSGPILDLGSLNERRFGITSGDGQHLEVEISEFVLRRVRSALLNVMWSFEWLGPGNLPVRRGLTDA